MKDHEKKAVVRAIEWLSAGDEYNWETREDLARDAVKLAEYRAGRTYDADTKEEAIAYGTWTLTPGWKWEPWKWDPDPEEEDLDEWRWDEP